MDIFTLLQNQIALFFLVFVRISGMIITSPVFGSRNIPLPIKAGLSIFLALTVFPLLAQPLPLPDQLLPYVFMVAGELVFGIILGFASSLIFYAVQMTGSILDMQIGFGVVNIFDPQVGQQVPLLGNFKYILALLLFLIANGHHVLLTSICNSFKIVPVTGIVFHSSVTAMIVNMVSGIFIIAFQITVPVLAAIIITDVALGILARTMPQMNVFVVGVPAKIIVGIFVLSVALPFFMIFLEAGFNGMYRDVYRLLELFSR